MITFVIPFLYQFATSINRHIYIFKAISRPFTDVFCGEDFASAVEIEGKIGNEFR